MEVDGGLKMFAVTKAAGHLLDCLDSGVQPFADRIGDSMLQVVNVKHFSHYCGKNISQGHGKDISHPSGKQISHTRLE